MSDTNRRKNENQHASFPKKANKRTSEKSKKKKENKEVTISGNVLKIYDNNIIGGKLNGIEKFPVLQNETHDRRKLYPRADLLWDIVEPNQIAHLLGIHLNGLTGEKAKEMLRERKVWPYYYPTPSDSSDFDCFPADLRPNTSIHKPEIMKNREKTQKPSQKKLKKASSALKKLKKKFSLHR